MGSLIVTQVGKAYRRYPSKWSRIAEWMLGGERHIKTWVLRDVSFSVGPGEAVGLVGMNGAGKSTLLKIVTGTTQATIGSVSSAGRVAALLELGMGFHADFTGRQNVVMAGQILGLSLAEISRCMPEIERFAEIGSYMDRPVRVYSSGMQMRLAFSVATAVRPDILIVDEALSVGDAYFQHKSFEKIREFRKQGTTLLIVSHDKSAIQNLCDRAILLQDGNVRADGPPEEVMDLYNALLADKQHSNVRTKQLDDGRQQISSGTGEARVTEVVLTDVVGREISDVNVGERVSLRIDVRVDVALPRLVLGYGIKDRLGQVMFGTNTELRSCAALDVPAGSQARYSFTFDACLGPGSYSVHTALTSGETHLGDNYEWRELVLIFTVINRDKTKFSGSVWMEPEISFTPFLPRDSSDDGRSLDETHSETPPRI
jgi:lipopolysaccharide transport system ATP-binding protein